MNTHKAILSSVVTAIAMTMGCTAEVPSSGGDLGVTESSVTASNLCPSGNGFYVLYYGSALADFITIANAQPNFVVLGNGLEARSDLTALFHGTTSNYKGPSVRAVAYLPTGDSQTNLDARISTALGAGFDGVFFDEVIPSPTSTYPNADTYNAHVSQLVHNAGKMVIMNPGVANAGTDIFNYADIVSVENQWDAANYPLNPSGVPAWRWLAVQGDNGGHSEIPDYNAPNNSSAALSRLSTFRSNDGFWYYSSNPQDTTHLPSWFGTFANGVKALGTAPCGSSQPPPPSAINNAGSGPYVLGIHTFNQANNVELTGNWTTVQNTAGQTLLSGFSPIDYHLPAGTYRITAANFSGPSTTYTFNHWDDHSTAQPRTVTLTTSPSGLWTGAWYAVTTP